MPAADRSADLHDLRVAVARSTHGGELNAEAAAKHAPHRSRCSY